MATKILNRPNTVLTALSAGAAVVLAPGHLLLNNGSAGNLIDTLQNENIPFAVDETELYWGLAVGPGHSGSGVSVSSYVGYQPYVAGAQGPGCDFAAPPAPVPAAVISGVTAALASAA